ncbi:dephospho-CoA kinase [Pigmentibacter ruber]|uniref:dephospho-CoA kinase n=1 Tax=Pigmentibacter ruber TaxID=2683196 RepID=UPI00131DDBFB|nr:dephospho-CoA kinase [Pigmentibacter ruber]
MAKKIVITGGIGSGKSLLSKMLAKRGYCVWDADIISREVLFYPAVQARIKSIFGEEVFVSNGILNREFVRNLIFSDPKLKKLFEKIMHPAMNEHFNLKFQSINKLAPTAWVFYEASLILELNRKADFDFCIVVTAQEDIKLSRLKENRNLDEVAAKKIMASQMPDNEKISYADYVIDNSSSIENLEKNVEKLIHLLTLKLCV